MGWILCLVFCIAYVFTGDPIQLLAAALFAISGAISEVASVIRPRNN